MSKAGKNTHMEHLEDEIINKGTEGGAQVIKILKEMANFLDGTGNSGAAVTVDNAKGVFRLTSNVQDWQIGNSSTYGISFEAVEVIT